MSLRSDEGDDLRELRPFRKDHLALRIDEGGVSPRDRKIGMRAEPARSFAADAHREVRALLDVVRPRVGLQREPLGRDVVEDEEEHADRAEDREEARALLPDCATADALEAALDEGPAFVVGEVAEGAEPGLHTA